MPEHKFLRTTAALIATLTGLTTSAELLGRLSFPNISVEQVTKNVIRKGIQRGLITFSVDDLNSGNKVLLTLGIDDEQDFTSISPDGTQIAYINQSINDRKWSIRVVSLPGSYVTTLVDISFFNNYLRKPVWVDNKTIAYPAQNKDVTKRPNNQNGIGFIKIDGTRYQLDFTFNNFIDVPTFCFSNQNKKIYFTGTKLDANGKYFEVYSINLNGTNPKYIRKIDSTNKYVFNMRCTSDKIYLDLFPRGSAETYVMSTDGTSLQKVN